MKPTLGLSDRPTALSGTWLAGTTVDRNLSVLRRVARAGFTTPTRFEIEIDDRYRPGRRWIAALELVGFGWRLTEMHIVPADRGLRAKTAALR